MGFYCLCYTATFDDAELTTPVSTVEFIGPFATSEQLDQYIHRDGAFCADGPYGTPEWYALKLPVPLLPFQPFGLWALTD